MLVTDKKFYMNKKLKENLDVGLYATKEKNQDLLIIIDGGEGSGKSLTARQVGYYCAHVLETTFNTEKATNIHFDLQEYIDFSLKGIKGQVNILDESRKILNRKRSMGTEAVAFTNYLSECRSRNQVHIVVLPAYHDLDRYIALWRVSMVIHMSKEWTEDDKVELGGHELRLGSFKAYPNNSKYKQCYEWKGYNYPNEYICRDRFSGFEVMSEQGLKSYQEKKDHFMSVKYGAIDDKTVYQKKEEECLRVMLAFKKHGFPVLHMGLVAEICNVSNTSASKYLEKNSGVFKSMRKDY